MLFNSKAFAIFLPLALIIYWALRNTRRQNIFLVAASLFFYGWWDPRFLSLLLVSIVVDYSAARGIAAAQARKRRGRGWLSLSVITNLGLLGAFKYYDFFIDSARPLWDQLGWRPDLLGIVLPVGISFYTFQTMSYTIDVYRGQCEARRSLIDVAAFVTFFPQLVAGPIERAARLLPQFEKPRSLSAEMVRQGLILILIGFMKKLILADGIASLVNLYYGRLELGADAAQPVDGVDMLLATYGFIIQVYGDFSGYSNIARGVARLLGFELMVNFRQPFFATSTTDLWRRWHISLGAWLRDYLYFSLGGSKRGAVLTNVNIILTMLLGGLWHGANWTFVLWGGVLAVALVFERSLMRAGYLKLESRWSRIAGIIVTFNVFSLSAVFFRSPDIGVAWQALTLVFTDFGSPDAWALAVYAAAMGFIILVDLPHVLEPKEELPVAHRPAWLALTITVAGAAFYLLPPMDEVSFIYFQF